MVAMVAMAKTAWLQTGTASFEPTQLFVTMQSSNQFDPGSSGFNNLDSPKPFGESLMHQPIWKLVHHTGVHTPSQKIQKVGMWFTVSKVLVEEEVKSIVAQEISTYFPPGLVYNRRTNAQYLQIQANGRHWTQQRVSALEIGRKMMIDSIMLQETWLSLMPATPYNWAYLDWVKKSATVQIEMDSVQNQLELMSVCNKAKNQRS